MKFFLAQNLPIWIQNRDNNMAGHISGKYVTFPTEYQEPQNVEECFKPCSVLLAAGHESYRKNSAQSARGVVFLKWNKYKPEGKGELLFHEDEGFLTKVCNKFGNENVRLQVTLCGRPAHVVSVPEEPHNIHSVDGSVQMEDAVFVNDIGVIDKLKNMKLENVEELNGVNGMETDEPQWEFSSGEMMPVDIYNGQKFVDTAVHIPKCICATQQDGDDAGIAAEVTVAVTINPKLFKFLAAY